MATGLKHELFVAGAWTDVSGHVMEATSTVITNGKSSDGLATSQQATFVLRDPDGRYWPANPTGAYYGSIGRNTRHRVSVDPPGSFAQIFDGSGADTISTPDSSGLSVTGDLDIRIDVDLDSWRGATNIIGKWTSTGNNRSYRLILNSTGYFGFAWSEDGVAMLYRYSSCPVPIETGRISLRATIDVDNGASGRDIKFYTSTDTDLSSASWTQLGSTRTSTGTTSIYDGTASVEIGNLGITGYEFSGRVYSALILDGIAGTPVGSPDFTAAAEADTTVTDSQSNVWTRAGNAVFVDRAFLWHGEVRDWPHTQDSTGTMQTVSATSRGLTSRRMSSNTPLRSAYYRGCTSTVAPVENLLSYHPLEDGQDSTQLASGLPGGIPGGYAGSPSLASCSDFACSDSIITLADGAGLSLPVPAHVTSTEYQAWLLFSFPDSITSTTRLFDVRTSGDLARLTINITTEGYLRLTAQDVSGTTVYTGTLWNFDVLGGQMRIGVSWYTSGANTVCKISRLRVGQTIGQASVEETVTGYVHGRFYGVSVAPDLDLSGVGVGHCTTQSERTSLYALSDLLQAHSGETAADRLIRIGSEEGIPVRVFGGNTVAMGPQRVATLSQIVGECADADGGILSADTDRLGLVYRTRSSMQSTDPVVTLDYDSGDLTEWQPVYDDQLTVNRLELSRPYGGTAVEEVTDGPMSILDPPDGVGLSPVSATVNVESDRDLTDQCWWRLNVGTCQDPRLPDLTVELERAAVTDAQHAALLGIRYGDRVDVTGVPVTQYPGDLTQIMVGVRRMVTHFLHEVAAHCVPFESYRVFRIGVDRIASATVETVTFGGVLFAGSQCRSYPATQQAGDLDVRAWVTLDDWTPSSEEVIVARYDNSGGANERSWAFLVTAAGLLQCYLSVDGTTAYTYYSSAGPGYTDGDDHWVRFVYDSASGDVVFYTSEDSVSWVQLGTTVTGSAVGGLYDADADFQLGARSAGSLTSDMHGTVHEIRIVDGSEVSSVPTRDNVGADMGTSWSTQSGNLYVDAGATYEDYKFEDCRVRVRTGDTVTFTNCWFAGNSTLTDEHGLLDCTHADVADVTATNCTFTPETPTAYMTGVLGHHFELYDCLITNCADGVGVYNTDSGQEDAATGVIVDHCWIGDHAWFATAPNQADGSHCDGVQLQGGADTIIRDTVLEAYIDITVGDSPWGRVGDPENRALSAIMITPNVGNITDTIVQGCYLSGGEILVNGSAAGNSGNDLGDWIGCKVFDDSWYYWESIDEWLYMHASATYSESGTEYVTEYPAESGGGLLAPTDPADWTDGYAGSGTGSTVVENPAISTTVLASSATTTATSLSITASDADGWTHDDGDYEATLGGEVVTVTAVSGSAPSQTLTVTRSVNSVVKAHDAGTEIQLYRPARVGLPH
jgi:plastocyanin